MAVEEATGDVGRFAGTEEIGPAMRPAGFVSWAWRKEGSGVSGHLLL